MAIDNESLLLGMASGSVIKYCERILPLHDHGVFAFEVSVADGKRIEIDTMTVPYSYHEFAVSWGDGEVFSRYITGNPLTFSHTYQKSGIYRVVMVGRFRSFGFSIDSAPYVTALLTPLPEESYIQGMQFRPVGFELAALTQARKSFYSVCHVDAGEWLHSGCTSLTEIEPGYLSRFDSVSSFYNAFSGCSELTVLPEDLFSTCTAAENFESAFAFCTNLSTVPETLFDNCQVQNFSHCFEGCVSLRHLPELWAKFPNANHTDCFYGCTNADNYADCPTDWK